MEGEGEPISRVQRTWWGCSASKGEKGDESIKGCKSELVARLLNDEARVGAHDSSCVLHIPQRTSRALQCAAHTSSRGSQNQKVV